MIEALGVIAALIAIGSFLWATVRHLRPERAKRAQALKEAKATLAYSCDNWREASLSSKHMHILSYGDFLQVAVHKNRMADLPEEERLFIFMCATVHGRWGDWMPRDVDSDKIIAAVLPLIDGRCGWRPVWRAAYIVELWADESKYDWHTYIPEELKNNDNMALVSKIVSGIGVIRYLTGLAKGDNPHLLDKSYALLQEIDTYSPGKVPPEFNKAYLPNRG